MRVPQDPRNVSFSSSRRRNIIICPPSERTSSFLGGFRPNLQEIVRETVSRDLQHRLFRLSGSSLSNPFVLVATYVKFYSTTNFSDINETSGCTRNKKNREKVIWRDRKDLKLKFCCLDISVSEL